MAQTSPHPAWLAAALCVMTTGVNLQAPLYAAYARADGVGVMATTLAFSFYVAGVLPVLLALGGLSDRIGRRRVMLLALALSAGGTLLMLLHPHVSTLAVARLVLGTGTALMSATATAYMLELFGGERASRAANWVTASTSIGFGLGPVLTSVCLMLQESLTPPSFLLHLAAVAVCGVLVWRLPETAPRSGPRAPMLRLPYFTGEGLWFGAAILIVLGHDGPGDLDPAVSAGAARAVAIFRAGHHAGHQLRPAVPADGPAAGAASRGPHRADGAGAGLCTAGLGRLVRHAGWRCWWAHWPPAAPVMASSTWAGWPARPKRPAIRRPAPAPPTS